jgi:hypothetical protein
LLADIGLDHLPGNLITQGAGQCLEMVELGAPGHTPRENLLAQLIRHSP